MFGGRRGRPTRDSEVQVYLPRSPYLYLELGAEDVCAPSEEILDGHGRRWNRVEHRLMESWDAQVMLALSWREPYHPGFEKYILGVGPFRIAMVFAETKQIGRISRRSSMRGYAASYQAWDGVSRSTVRRCQTGRSPLEVRPAFGREACVRTRRWALYGKSVSSRGGEATSVLELDELSRYTHCSTICHPNEPTHMHYIPLAPTPLKLGIR